MALALRWEHRCVILQADQRTMSIETNYYMAECRLIVFHAKAFSRVKLNAHCRDSKLRPVLIVYTRLR